MCHFYRLMSQIDKPLPRGIEHVNDRSTAHYKLPGQNYKLADLVELEALDVEGKYRLCKAPEIAKEDIAFEPEFAVEGEATLPDLWTQKGRALVSQKFKNIVGALDDFPHQFEPVNVYKNGEIWDLGQPYYRMKVRRRVVFEPGEWGHGESYSLSPKEKYIYRTLIVPEFK